MASIRQRGGKKKYWHAQWRDPQGNLVERSTKTSDKKKAQDLADEWESMANPKGEMAAANMRRVIADLHLKLLGTEAPTMTTRAFCEHWKALRWGEIGADTKRVYTGVLDSFLKCLGEKADKDFFLVQKTDVVKFRDDQKLRNSAATANHKMKIVRMMVRQAFDDGWITENICAGVKPAKDDLRHEKKGRDPYEIDELKVVLNACNTAEWQAMVIRGYYTGQRLLDVALMKRGNEDPSTAKVSMVTHKTGRTVVLDMPPAYVDWVLSQDLGDDPRVPLHPKAYETVMKRINAGKPSVSVTLSGQFRRILERAGFRAKPVHWKKRKKEVAIEGKKTKRTSNSLVYHSLRHSFVSHLADAGVDQTVVQQLVGHSSKAMTDIYTHVSDPRKKSAMHKLADITNLKNPKFP